MRDAGLHRVLLAVIMLRCSLAAQTVRDSAGTRLVHSDRPLWTPAQGWRLAAEPSIEIGSGLAGTEGSASELSRVTGVVTLSDGTIVIADAGTHAVRLFARDGRHVRSFGRQGNGPGEFQAILGLHVLTGDTIVVIASPGPPVTRALYFTRDGTFRHQRTLSEGDRRWVAPVFHGSGAMIAWEMPPAGLGDPRSGSSVDSLALVRVLGAGPPQRLGRHPFAEGRSTNAGVPTLTVFASHAALAAKAEHIYLAFGPRASIASLDANGRVVRIASRPPAGTPIPPDAAARYRTAALSANPIPAIYRGAARAQIEAQRAASLRDLHVATRLPAYHRLLSAPEGHVWAERYLPAHGYPTCGSHACVMTLDVATAWDVFDAAGRWLGSVTMPPRFSPVAIGTAEVIGLARDEDRVESVRIHRIVKP